MANVKGYELKIDIKKDGDYYLASCPDWVDCYAQGNTLDEATSEVIAVASGLIDLYDEEDLVVPLDYSKETVSAKNKISFSVPVFASI